MPEVTCYSLLCSYLSNIMFCTLEITSLCINVLDLCQVAYFPFCFATFQFARLLSLARGSLLLYFYYTISVLKISVLGS